MVWFIISTIISGLIAGFLARALVPGRDPMGVLGTIVLGIVGSFIGGFLGYLLFNKDLDEGALQPAGIIGAIIGAIIALLIWRAVQSRSRAARARRVVGRSRQPTAARRPRPGIGPGYATAPSDQRSAILAPAGDPPAHGLQALGERGLVQRPDLRLELEVDGVVVVVDRGDLGDRRRIRRTSSGGPAAARAAILNAASRRASSSTHRHTSPTARPRPRRAPRRTATMAAVACGPTIRRSIQVCPPPGCSPRWRKRVSNWPAGRRGARRSTSARFMPAPTAAPLTAAMVGSGQRPTRRKPS